MPLSTEALLALLSIFVNLPPAIFIIWRTIARRRNPTAIASGSSHELEYKSFALLTRSLSPEPDTLELSPHNHLSRRGNGADLGGEGWIVRRQVSLHEIVVTVPSSR